jgi:hypothetical protein
LSWLEPDVVRAARAALAADDLDGWLEPAFRAPPLPAALPPSIAASDWPAVAEHVARAERTSAVIREHGLHEALARFRCSRHAVELATLVAAAAQFAGAETDADPDADTGADATPDPRRHDRLVFELCEAVLAADIDEQILYGTFLALLVAAGRDDQPARVIGAYERFTVAASAHAPGHPARERAWLDAARSFRDGLASVYVQLGRAADGDRLFRERHDEDPGDLVVALSASRAFLAAGDRDRAAEWLERGALRADSLDREELADTLRKKAAAVRPK